MLFDLETQLEQELPLRLQGTLQESLDSHRPSAENTERDATAGARRTSEFAVRLAVLGVSYAQAGWSMRSVKSTLCRWVRRETLRQPVLSGRAWELHGLWTRIRSGPGEMRVIRDELGTVLESFEPWADMIDRIWRQA